MIKKIILTVATWLIVVNIFAMASLNRYNLQADTAYTWINAEEFSQDQNWDIVSLHSRWDSLWYLDIAQNGYSFQGVGKLSNLVFFPLYPILIYIFSFFTLGDFMLAGWLVSLLFLFLAIFYLYKLVNEFHRKSNPQHTIFLLLIFPTAFFLNAIYTESLFLFLSVATFYYALRKNFLLACIFGFLASLSRITGILLFIPLLWEYYLFYKSSKRLNRKFLFPLLIPAGTFLFFLHNYFAFDDFYIFLKVQDWFGRGFELNQEHFLLLTNPSTINFSLDLFFLIFALISTYFVFTKIRFSYGLYMLATTLLALSTGTLMSIGRYILVLFPIYILGASIKNQYVIQIWVLISVLLLSMNITLFVNNYWAG